MQGTSVQRCVGAPPPQACCSRVRRLSAVPGAPTLLTKRVSLRSRVVALQSHKQEDYTSSSTRYYGSPTPRAISSSVQSVSFNQQLLVVLAVPLAALGVPFILGHPLVCIVLPLIVYSTPGLRAIAAPICTALVQLILSGLRPSGSPRSEAFPWQQANNSAWSSPAIDVDYRALPGESQEDTYNQTDTVNRSSRQERWQQKSEYDVETAQAQKQPYRQQVDLQPRQRPASVARQRRKVNIRPAGQSMPNEARVVRQERPGQVGVNLRPVDTVEPRSNVVRALLVVFPFLRDWGGFL